MINQAVKANFELGHCTVIEPGGPNPEPNVPNSLPAPGVAESYCA